MSKGIEKLSIKNKLWWAIFLALIFSCPKILVYFREFEILHGYIAFFHFFSGLFYALLFLEFLEKFRANIFLKIALGILIHVVLSYASIQVHFFLFDSFTEFF
jgi:hypothetical protein